MYSIWVSLKESTNCSCTTSDFHQPMRASKRRHERVAEEPVKRMNLKRDLQLLKRQHSQRDCSSQYRFYELSMGDPSRNVIEMIFQTTYMKRSNHARKIERVLRVKNTAEALKRFEECREAVKKRAYDQFMTRHPRVLVDGNELLLFYSTAMTCCCSCKRQKVSKLYHGHTCSICMMIQSGFNTYNTKKKEIQLSTTIDTRNEQAVCVKKGSNVKKAVVACRVIAGRVANSKVERGREEEFDSVSSKGLRSNLEHLFVWNYNAALPCFAIIYI